MTIRIALIDDHELFREGLKLLIGARAEFRVVGEAATVGPALNLVERASFDLLVLDMALPGASGLTLLRDLARRETRPSNDGAQHARRARPRR